VVAAAPPSTSVQPAEEVLEGKPVPLATVKALIERERELRGQTAEDLTYEQKLAADHASTFARLPMGQADELLGKLLALPKVTPAQAAKIVDLAPSHPDDVRAVFAKDRVQLEKDEIDKILELVRGYLG